MTNLALGAWGFLLLAFCIFVKSLDLIAWLADRSGLHDRARVWFPMRKSPYGPGVDLYRAQGYTLRRAKAEAAKAK